MKKFVTMLGVLVLTLLLLTGCGSGYTFAERTEQMHEYMEEKYGVEFQVDWDSQAVTREYHSWNCSLKGNTDENKKGKIEVQNWYDREEEPFVDTYFSILIQDVTEERVRTAFADMTEPYRLDVADSGFVDNKFTSVDQYDQFLEEKGNDYNAHVVKVVLLDQGSEEANAALVEEFIQRMKTANIGNVYCNIYCVTEETYETVDESNVTGLNEIYVYRKAGRLNEIDHTYYGTQEGGQSAGENSSTDNTHSAKICNIDTDTLPYNEESIYQQLFDINNKIEVELDITEEVMQQLQHDYEAYERIGSKSPLYREADLKITITTERDTVTYVIDKVGVRMKGNTSRTDFYDVAEGQYNLIHFKVDFGERTFATLEKLELRWNKNDDSTYIREYYAYEMYRDLGVLAPHINLATMQVAGKHQGVFTICEPVDKLFIEKYVAKVDQGGDLYKCNWAKVGANLTSKCSIGVENEETGEFYNYDLKTNKKKSDHARMKNLLAVLNKKNVTKEEIAEVVDMDKFLLFEAVTYFTGNPDDIRNDYNNYYIYFLESSGKAVFIPYDVDRVFGLTKDWNPLGNAMTDVNPFSTKAESMNVPQENPLYIHTVNEGGYYVEEFTEVLKQVAASKWLTTEQFDEIYNTAYALYSEVTKPDETYDNAKRHNFTMDLNKSDGLRSDKGNASFAEYLEAKLKAYQSYVK